MASDPREVAAPDGWGLDGVAVCALRIDGEAPALAAEEGIGLEGAVPARVREHAFGRAAAREALRRAGCPAPGPLPRRPDRAPSLPAGFAGSISHTRGLAVACAARAERWRSLGVDVEGIRDVEPGVAEIVATPAERHLPTLAVFAAKEAAFKAWFTAGGGRIAEFHEFEVALDGDRFVVVRHPPPRLAWAGRIGRAEGHWWSLAGVPA